MTSSLEHSFRKAGTKKETLEGPFYSRRRKKMKTLAWIDWSWRGADGAAHLAASVSGAGERKKAANRQDSDESVSANDILPRTLVPQSGNKKGDSRGAVLFPAAQENEDACMDRRLTLRAWPIGIFSRPTERQTGTSRLVEEVSGLALRRASSPQRLARFTCLSGRTTIAKISEAAITVSTGCKNPATRSPYSLHGRKIRLN
jgi:hypothetical protein